MIQSLSSGMQAQWYRHPQGDVQDDGQTVDTLRVVDFPKPYALIKESRGLFVPADVKVAPEAATDYQVVGGALAESKVNAVRTMVEMIDMLRKYETSQRAIQAEDDAARYASNDMGRLQTPVIRALYSSASGMQAQQLNLEAIANNLSNVNTAGFSVPASTSRISCTRPSAPRAPRAPKARPFPPVSGPRER